MRLCVLDSSTDVQLLALEMPICDLRSAVTLLMLLSDHGGADDKYGCARTWIEAHVEKLADDVWRKFHGEPELASDADDTDGEGDGRMSLAPASYHGVESAIIELQGFVEVLHVYVERTVKSDDGGADGLVYLVGQLCGHLTELEVAFYGPVGGGPEAA